jgi:hypothetical protein
MPEYIKHERIFFPHLHEREPQQEPQENRHSQHPEFSSRETEVETDVTAEHRAYHEQRPIAAKQQKGFRHALI